MSFLTISEVSQALRVSTATVRRLIRAGTLPWIRCRVQLQSRDL